MRISAKTEYAAIAMLELAAAYEAGEPVRIRQIAEEHQIPSRFLVQILLQLKGAGLVASTRGAGGGYQLARPPEEITLAEVMAVIDGPPEQGLVSSASPDSVAAKVLMRIWRQTARAQQEMLSEITLAELVQRAQQDAESMYYI